MPDVVFSRGTWMPAVVDDDGQLLLDVVGGADALHGPRTFTVPVTHEHAEVVRTSVRRHLLLYAALLPLCYDAGVAGPWDEEAAAALLDPVLVGTPQEVDDALRRARVDRRVLVAHHVSLRLLKARRYYEAAQSATAESDWARVRKHLGV
ncbi:hypothetical protein AWH69_14155 [Janibacter melonis]|uniref:Uncharacterized protein n=1 Tax=Janibacter melonis TaxID=262209 RepID=A0A176Q9Y9_9MICO|nr:DUF6357 family protein [Janibacter melonis]OAB86469.1 hypothetical protein AWH69_14155 [Janibacter melonis]